MLPDELDLLLVEDNPLEAELLLVRGAYRHRLGGPLPLLVLLELKLPRLDGIEVLRTLRASPRPGTVPVVVLTSSAEPREVAQCYQAGANSCIRKPIEFREFAETVRALGRYWLRLNRAAPSGVPAG